MGDQGPVNGAGRPKSQGIVRLALGDETAWAFYEDARFLILLMEAIEGIAVRMRV